MFKVIDYIVTSVATLGKKTSMSHTPGARSLVGRDHFFNPLTEDTKFQKMVHQFEQSLDKLDESKTHTIKL